MAKITALIAGESWVTAASHHKGWDFFSSTTFHTGVEHLQQALESQGIGVVYMPSHTAASEFPLTAHALRAFDVVILSDIGANTLLLHPETWLHGKPMPNRLRAIAEFVHGGGGLAMAGGYYSFGGIYGAAHYHGTPLEAVLPVDILPYDDRVEAPEGFSPEVVLPSHPVVAGLDGPWPILLGFNDLRAKSDALVLAAHEGRPILAVRQVHRGRTLAWASDVGPHWCPEAFLSWSGFQQLWGQALRWLAGTTS